MHVIVVGAGAVGQAIAANLEDSHDVVVIDPDSDIVETELLTTFSPSAATEPNSGRCARPESNEPIS